jgi:hypothetical protein
MDIISQIEQKDETFKGDSSLEAQAAITRRRDSLKRLRASLKDRELSLAEHEILLLRNEAQFSTM